MNMRRSSKAITPFALLFLFLTILSPAPLFAESESEVIRLAEALSGAFEGVATTITPALVNIRAVTKPPVSTAPPAIQPQHGTPKDLPEPFRDFFERFGRKLPFNSPQAPHGGQQPHGGLGSGVLVDSAGHILTNNHVVAAADDLTVRLSDGRSFKATVVGTDSRTDLAVIKIDAKNLHPAKLGDSDKLKIGEWVVAAGTPFGLENTITTGIVSAKGRSIMGGNAYEDFIQTDAAINPGNSGGPLANLRGEVIGINTAIFSRSGGYMGIGFAIPINMAKQIMQSLIEDGKVTRGWLGVVIQELSEDLAKSFGHDSKSGALVSAVAPDSPANKAGIESGDIIIQFNGNDIETVNDLRNMVAAEAPETNVSVTVIRDAKQKRLSVVLSELPIQGGFPLAEEPSVVEDSNYASEIGVRVEPLTEKIKSELKSTAQSGVVISQVAPGSLAAEAGVRPGDIIEQIDGKSITSLKAFEKTMKTIDIKKGIRMRIETRGMNRYLFLKQG